MCAHQTSSCCRQHNIPTRKSAPRSVAASNKTVAGITGEVLPAQGKRAGRRIATPSPTIGSLKSWKRVTGAGHFYNHAEGDTMWVEVPSTCSTLTTKLPIRSRDANRFDDSGVILQSGNVRLVFMSIDSGVVHDLCVAVYT